MQQTSDPHMGTGVGRGRAEQKPWPGLAKSKAKVVRKGSWEPPPRFLSASPLFIPGVVRSMHSSQRQRTKPTDRDITIIFVTHERGVGVV